VIELAPRAAPRQIPHLGKIRQSHPPWLLPLTEDNLPVLTVQGPPMTDPPLNRSTQTVGNLRVASLHLLEDRDPPQPRRRLQHRYDLGVKNAHQRIGPTPTAGQRFLGW